MLVPPQARQLSRSCIQPFDDARGTAVETLLARLAGFAQPVPIRQRESLRVHEPIEGPLLLIERTSTTPLLAGWRGKLDLQGHLLLSRE